MSKTSVPFAPETLETIQRSIRLATERRHDAVGLEHLLLAATDEPSQVVGAEGSFLVIRRGTVR